MYPSGVWRGFWQQKEFGRQPMEDFRLAFRDGIVTGSGTDVIGPFVFRGEYNTQTGRVSMMKQYLGRHRVLYDGHPDGEGCIGGTWSIPGVGDVYTGPFLLRPVIDGGAAAGDDEFTEIVK